MNDLIINIDGQEYTLVYDNAAIMMAEKKIGRSLLGFASIAGEGDEINFRSLPTLEELMIMFHAGLQSRHHGISLNTAKELYALMQANESDYEHGAFMTLLMHVIGGVTTAFFGRGAVNKAQKAKKA